MAPLYCDRAMSRDGSGCRGLALRFYEQRGLISSERGRLGSPFTTHTGARRIGHRLRTARRADGSMRSYGLAKLPEHYRPTRPTGQRLSRKWTGESDHSIAELERLKQG